MKLGLVSFILPCITRRSLEISRASSSYLCRNVQKDPASNDLTIDIAPPLNSTLQISQLMYSYTDLRKFVGQHEETFLSAWQKKLTKTVKFQHPEYIDTRNCPDDDFVNTKLKSPITAGGILKFLKENQRYFEQPEGEDIKFDAKGANTERIFMMDKLDKLAGFDADIVEFDDTNNPKFFFVLRGTELVYAIIINRSEKRVVVVFRGSVVLKDWFEDLNFRKSIPTEIKEFTDKEVKIHAGFGNYLLEIEGSNDKTKFEEIIATLREIYSKKEYSDYELLVTGHSLGGALTQLLSFMLAGSPRADFIPKPIVAISFASPVVGNDVYREVTQELERDNKLRHIRVSNENDVVPGYPPPIFSGEKFTQTGVNLHLKEGNRMDVAYRNTKSIFGLVSFPNIFKSIVCHNLEGENSYNRRMYCVDEKGDLRNDDILKMTVSELYKKYAGDCTK